MIHMRISSYILCGAIILCGCQNELLKVYRIDIQQGNALDVESVEKITLGMNKEQVRFVLGNPLIVDSFHPDRWDYVYTFTPGQGEKKRQRLTLIFDRDEITEIIKDNIVADHPLPSGQVTDDGS